MVPALSRATAPSSLLHLTKSSALAVFLLISGAFAALIASHALSDFTVLTVIQNSHSLKPMLYKITGAWGNHEGSMLLWMWVLSALAFLVAYFRAQDTELKAYTLSTIGLMSSGFLAFILFTSNPFLRVFPPPADGEDLNPILQDIGLAFHPPTLYIGYVGFGIVFAYAIAGLRLNRIDPSWAKQIRPWILLPWCFLTLGIGAGSWWAYRELGWGGWWFWDPVENVSLLPWLVGTALLHSNLVLERRGQLGGWVVLLAILTFTMSLIGTFIVRSGLITSVHSFASDPLRGLFILGYIGIVSGSALLVYGLSDIHKTPSVTLSSRSGLILINNLLLMSGAGVILMAILYPLGLELAGLPSVSVGAPYFNRTFLPMTAALPFLAAIAPLIAWDRTSRTQWRRVLKRLAPSLLIALLIGFTSYRADLALGLVGAAMGAWLLWGTARYIRTMMRAKLAFTSAIGLRHLATAFGHTGLALLVLGITTTSLLKETYEAPLTSEAPITFGHYRLTITHAERKEEANYTARRATFEISRDGYSVTSLTPQLRYYPVRAMQTTEAALYSTPLRDIYLVLGETNYHDGKTQAVLGIRMYVMPGQQWLWAGFICAGLGGVMGLLSVYRARKEK